MMKYIYTFIIGLFAMGCSPKLAEPAVEIPESYTYGGDILSQSDTLSLWWYSCADPTLQILINEALATNRTLAATMSAVSEARYNLNVARAKYLPSISLGVEAERTRELETYESQYQVVPTVSWQVPLFGAYRSTKGVAQSQLLTKEWETRAAMLTLASEVATTYYSMLQYRATLRVSQRCFSLRSAATTLIDSMYRYGMSSRVELEQAQSLVYAAQQDIDRYQESVRLSELSLALLLSRSIEQVDFSSITVDIESLPLPPTVTSGVPSELLYNRPDLRVSYYQLQQAMAEVGVARSAQFPSLSLTAEGGLFATSLSGLTLSRLLTWEWAADLAQPIFNFASLKSKRKGAIAAYEATLLTYEQDIIVALKDVESALLSITATREMSRSARLYMDSYANISRSTSALYRGGMDTYLNVVDAQRQLYASQIDYIELLSQQQINYVNLYTALGGNLSFYENALRMAAGALAGIFGCFGLSDALRF